MSDPRTWHDESPQEGARLATLGILERAQANRERLRSDDDAEALHDFRVSVRRLRSALRLLAPELGSAASKRSQRRWRDLAASTGPGRDAEAQREWLEAARDGLSPAARRAADALIARLSGKLSQEKEEVAAAARRFDRAAERLREELATFTVRLDAPPATESFGELTERRVREFGDELVTRLGAIDGARDVAGAHQARIHGKRLRYGLELAAPDARRPLQRLKALQDALGELHDVHGLMERIAKLAGREARDRARRLAEIAAGQGTASEDFRRERRRGSLPWPSLVDALRARQDALFAALRADWLAEPAAGIGRLLADAFAEDRERRRFGAAGGSPPAPR